MMSTSRASRGSKDKSAKTHTAQNAKPDPATMTSKQIQPTAEQMRIASAINNDRNEEDPEVQEKIQLVKEIYGNISDDTIFFTLHEHDFDLNKAVNALGDKQNPPADGKWESAATKKKKSSKSDVPPVMDKPERGDAGDRERGVSSGRGSNRRDKGPPRFQRGRGRENSEGGRPRRGGQEDGEAGERNNFEGGRGGRGRGRGGGRGGRGRGGRYDRSVGNMEGGGGSRVNQQAGATGIQSQFDSFDTHIDTWTNEVAENAEKGSNNIGSWQATEDWTADEWQGSLEQSTVFTASSTNDTSSNVFQTDATNNDNDAKMFSVSSIETQVFTAKSPPSNDGSKNSFRSSSGQAVNSVGTIGQQSTGGNQNAGTIGHNSLGQKAMGNQQQPSQLGQRLNIEDLLPKTVSPPAPMTGTEFLSQYAAKQAEEDIRSAVGIRPSQGTAPISRPTPQQQQDNRQQQKKTRLPPPSKIPASAVEMPGGVNYNQDAVQVQFGNWDSDNGGFSFGAGTTDNASTNGNHFNGNGSHQHSNSINAPAPQTMAQALTSTAMSSARGLESSPRPAASAGNTYPSTPTKQQQADVYSQQKQQESAFPPPPSQQQQQQQQEQRKSSPYAGSTAPPHRQQQQQSATGSLGSGNKPLSASYNQSGFTSPSSGSSGYPGSSFKSQSLSQSASAGYPSSTQRGESGSSSQYDSPRTSSSYSSSQQQQQASASESVSSSSAASSSFQQPSQQYTTSAAAASSASSSAFQPASVSSAPTSTYSSSASGDNASVSAAGGTSYQGTYNSSSNSYQPSSAFHRSTGSDYSQQQQQQNQPSSGGSSFGESSSRSQQQSNVYNSSSSSQYHQGTSSASSGYRDSSSVSSGGAGSSYGAPAAGSSAPYGAVSSPQAGSSQLNKLSNSLAKMATKDTSSEHESQSSQQQQQQQQQQYEQSVPSSSVSVISSSNTSTTTSKQIPHNPVTTTKAPPNLPPGVPPVLAPFNMMNQHGLPPAFYNLANLQQQPQQQPPQPDAAAMYNLDHIQMLQQQGRFPPMPSIAAAAVAAATAQQIQTAAAAAAGVPSAIPDQKLSTGYPGDSKMTRLEAQSPVNAISTSQHGSQQPQQPQQGAAAGQSQNPATFTFPPGYYNYYAANNPPVLPGGYSYPPNMFPVPSVTSHGGAGSSSQYGKPAATYPTAYNNYDSLAVAAAAAQNHQQQQQQDYKNKAINVSQSSGSVSDGLGGGSYGGKSGSVGYEKSYHHAAGTPPPPQPGTAAGFTSLLQATSNSSSMPTAAAAAAGAYGGAYVVPSHQPAHVAAGMVAPHHLQQDSVSALGRGVSGQQSSSGAPKNKFQTPYWSN